MSPDADAIAECVLATFDELPEKRKPRARSDGSREWVPLSGIVLVKGGELTCVSLGTGTKCLPTTKLPLCHGTTLHDWHAEILALRTFNRFLLDECLSLLTPPHTPSPFLRRRTSDEKTAAEWQEFMVREEVEIWMYCSEAPCGDASMELVMGRQEDGTPWTSDVPIIPGLLSLKTSTATATQPNTPTLTPTSTPTLRGRTHFSHLGALRLKPSRPDAPPTLSKSCTDKLTLVQYSSLLSSLPSLLISPRNAYLKGLVLPAEQYNDVSVTRAFTTKGRLSGMSGDVERGVDGWEGNGIGMDIGTVKGSGYTFHPFTILPTSPTCKDFSWSRSSVKEDTTRISSNISAVYTPRWQETLIGGVLQGRKQFDVRGASAISRRGMWRAVVGVFGMLGTEGVGRLGGMELGKTYAEVKACALLEGRRRVKEVGRGVLGGWIRNEGDDGFSLDD